MRNKFGWYYIVDQVVRGTQGVNEDDVFNWNWIRFLNRVNFLKQLGEVEIYESEIRMQNWRK